MLMYRCSRCAASELEEKTKLFIGDYRDDAGWRSVNLCLETGNIIESSLLGEVLLTREATNKELLLAVVEWCNAHQDSTFPTGLYRAISKSL